MWFNSEALATPLVLCTPSHASLHFAIFCACASTTLLVLHSLCMWEEDCFSFKLASFFQVIQSLDFFKQALSSAMPRASRRSVRPSAFRLNVRFPRFPLYQSTCVGGSDGSFFALLFHLRPAVQVHAGWPRQLWAQGGPGGAAAQPICQFKFWDLDLVLRQHQPDGSPKSWTSRRFVRSSRPRSRRVLRRPSKTWLLLSTSQQQVPL